MNFIQSDFVKTIELCTNCGEVCSGKYCPTCKTADGRQQMAIANRKIRLENEAKGYHYSKPV